MRAMLLSAGKGRRLYPLTHLRAKAALPVLNIPLIQYALHYLRGFSIGDVVINLHHLPHSIKEAVSKGGMEVHYSWEEELMGTAGGLKKAEEFLSGDDSLVINSDILTDYDLRELISFHQQHKALATMVLCPNRNPARFTPIEVSPEGKILRIGYQAEGESAGSNLPYMFTGIQMLSPEFFRFIPQGCYFELARDVYRPLLQQEVPLYGLIMESFWCELGTPREYLEANLLLLKGDAIARGLWSRVAPLGKTIPQLCGAPPPLLGEGVTLQKNAQFEGGVVIGDGSVIGQNCRIKNSLLWEDCSVGEGSHLEVSIVTAGVKLPPESLVRNRIVVAQRRGIDLQKGEPMGENLAFPF
ncbi:hypothetical protein CEE39_05650 [bacterium (candidate division B38) B3_B38]|nr:MAG: hypothetical protein CEE39_05650 [bacterium (candidate division B38) B3_B38]